MISNELKRIIFASLGAGIITSMLVYFTWPSDISLFWMVWGVCGGVVIGAMMREEAIHEQAKRK